MNTDKILLQIAREELGFETLVPRNWDTADFRSVGVESVKRALRRAFEAGQEAMVNDMPDGVAAAYLAHVQPPEDELQPAAAGVTNIPWHGGVLAVGDQFVSLSNETDSDHEDQKRVTPAGSVWWVDRIYPTAQEPYVRLVCDATGASINPSLDELTHEFERQQEARGE